MYFQIFLRELPFLAGYLASLGITHLRLTVSTQCTVILCGNCKDSYVYSLSAVIQFSLYRLPTKKFFLISQKGRLCVQKPAETAKRQNILGRNNRLLSFDKQGPRITTLLFRMLIAAGTCLLSRCQ
jgi:hypothetical protein